MILIWKTGVNTKRFKLIRFGKFPNEISPVLI